MHSLIVGVLCLIRPLAPAGQQAADPVSASAEESKFLETARRYRTILETRPQKGTAFDQWYRHYLDAGRLEELVIKVEDEARNNRDDYVAQMIAGLVYERRGEVELAIESYKRAEDLAPDSYSAPYLRGSLMAQQFQNDGSVSALQAAIGRHPPRAELLEIYKKLGRVYLRQDNTRAAMDTFRQIADAFPNDRQVLEELAELLAEENQLDEAIHRWEQVVALCKDDPYRQLLGRIELAQLHAQSGSVKIAIQIFDDALSDLDPESWLAKDIKRRVEEIFLHKNDLNGLATYYFQRLQRRPDDLDTMVHLAATFVQAGRQREAIERYDAAVRLAPSRRDIRESLIRELVRAGDFDGAIRHGEALSRQIPRDPAILRMLGQLYVDSASEKGRNDAEVKAIETWRQLAEIRPNDPTLALQAAEACRRAARLPDAPGGLARRIGRSFVSSELNAAPLQSSLLITAAEEFYREAMRRAPDVPQYHEYLGEYLHALGRNQDALVAWAAIAASPHDTAENWHRLAEVLNDFGHAEQAIDAGEKSIALQPDNYTYRELQVTLLIKHKNYDAAQQHVSQLDRLADTPFLEERALHRRVEVITASGGVDAEIELLRRLRDSGGTAMKDHWQLALLLAHRMRYVEAAENLELALRVAPNDTRLLKVRAAVLERAGNLAGAIQQYRRLIELEPKNSATHLERIAQLELDRGNARAAKDAADTVVRLAPAHLDAHRLRADIAFKLGEIDDGLQSLRHAVRINPRDLEMRRHLAKSLADHKRYEEAIEHFWRAFELADLLNDKLAIVKALSDLPSNALSHGGIVERLQQIRRRQDDPRVLTFCIVEALRWAKNYPAARRELTGLLDSRHDDIDVLKQLAALAEVQRDWTNAVAYQERVVAQAPTRENLETLARLCKQSGNDAAEAQVLTRLVEDAQDDSAIVDIVGRLVRRGDYRESLRIAEIGLAKRADDWRLLYWAAFAQFALGDVSTAREKYETILNLRDESKYDAPLGQSLSQPRTAPALGFGQGRSPELEDCKAAGAAHGRYQILMQAQQVRAATNSSSAKSSGTNKAQPMPRVLQQRLASVANLPPSQRIAKVDSTVMLFLTDQPERGIASQLRSRYEKARDDPEQLRRLVLGLVATGTPEESLPIFARFAELFPDDPLPHIARLLAVDSTKRLQSLSPEAREVRVQSLQASQDWIVQHRPELQFPLGLYYLSQLVQFGRTREAASFLAEAVDAATCLADISNLLRYAASLGDSSLTRKVVVRTTELAAGQTDPASIRTVQSLLADSYLATLHHDDMPAVMDLFERFMEMTAPVRVGSKLPRSRSVRSAPIAGTSSAQPTRIAPTPASAEFPFATPYLDGPRLAALLTVHNRMKTAQMIPLLSERLAALSLTEGSAGHAHRLAGIYVRWWSGDRTSAIQSLAELCDRLPGDPALRLSLAAAYHTSGDPLEALQVVATIRAVPGDLADEINRFVSGTLSQLSLASTDTALDGLFIELTGKGFEPRLGSFLGEPRQPAAAVANPNKQANAPRSTATTPISTNSSTENRARNATLPAPFQSRLPEILTRAQQRGILDELAHAADDRWQEYPHNLELLALKALISLTMSAQTSMDNTVSIWAERMESKKELSSLPESTLIAFSCLNHAELRPIGHRLMRYVLLDAVSRGRSELQQAVLARWTRAYVEDGDTAEAERLVEQVVAMLETDPTLNRKPGVDPAEARVYRLAALMPHVHPALLPDFLRQLRERVAANAESIKQPALIVQSIVEAMNQANWNGALDRRERVHEELVALLFPFGQDRAPSLGLWQVDGDNQVQGGLAGLVVSLAKSNDRLAQLRRNWDRHPDAGTLDMLTLRAEAALADGDIETAEALLARIEEISQSARLVPMLWSEWFLLRWNRVRLKAEFHQDFHEGQFSDRALIIVGNEGDQFVKCEAEGLRVTIPPGAGKKGFKGVASRFALQGDFDVTATYELIEAAEPVRVASMVLYVDFADSTNRASIQRVRRPDEGDVYTVSGFISRLGRTDRWEHRFPAASNTGQLRLIRRGSKLFFLVASAGSDDFRLLHRADCNSSVVQAVRAVVDIQAAVAYYPIDMRWLDLTVRAEELVGLQPN